MRVVEEQIASLVPRCNSEFGKLEVVALCAPAPQPVETQVEAEYVCFREPVSPQRALEAYERLRGALEANGVDVIGLDTYLDGEERALHEQLVNRTYLRDVAGVIGDTLVLGRSGVDVRQPDFHLAHVALLRLADQERVLQPLESPHGTLEFGDVLILNSDALLINVGWRTNRSGVEELIPYLFSRGYAEVGLISLPKDISLPHMDVVCNVVGRDYFLACSFLRHAPVEIRRPDSLPRYTMLPDFVRRHGYQVTWLPSGRDPLGYTNFINLDPDTLLARSLSE